MGLEPRTVSARSQKSAYAETGDMSSICVPCTGPVRVEARYDDLWQTPVTGALVRIEDSNGVALPGVQGGPATLGPLNFGTEDGQEAIPILRPEFGVFEHPQAQRGPVMVALVPEPDAQVTIDDLEAQILADLRAFAQQMQTALQPWIAEWEDSGWWGVVGTFFDAVRNGMVAWWEGEGDFWASAWEAITNIPDAVIDGIEAAGDAAVALWNNRDRIFQLMQAFADGAIDQIENLMTILADAFRNIPGLEEVAGLLVDLVENSADWAGAMIEMATQTRVMSVLFMTMGGAILMAPPNFWAEAVGTLGGYLIPEVILAVIFAVIAFFTAGAGGAGLAARLSLFVAKVTAKLAKAGRVGRIVLRVFSKLDKLAGKIKDLVRALKSNISEAKRGTTDAVTKILRRPYRAKFVDDIAGHIKKRDASVPRKRGIGGAHDKTEFNKALADEGGQVVSRKPHPTIKGVEKVDYRLAKLDKYGKPTGDLQKKTFTKTIYDSSSIPDSKMLKWGQEAADNAMDVGKGKLPREWVGVTSDGVRIRGYSDVDTGKVTSFFPDI